MCRYHKYTHNLYKHKYPSTHLPHLHTNTHKYTYIQTHKHVHPYTKSSLQILLSCVAGPASPGSDDTTGSLVCKVLPVVSTSARRSAKNTGLCSPLKRIISHLVIYLQNAHLMTFSATRPKGDVAHMAGHQTRD